MSGIGVIREFLCMMDRKLYFLIVSSPICVAGFGVNSLKRQACNVFIESGGGFRISEVRNNPLSTIFICVLPGIGFKASVWAIQ